MEDNKMRLVEARVKRRKTQWDLKKMAGINQTKVSLIERGYVTPTETEKAAIAEALGFNVDDIQWSSEEAAH